MNEPRHRWRSIPLLLTAATLLGACGDDESPGQAQASAASSTGSSTGGGGGAGGDNGGAGGAVQACPLGSTWSLVDDFVFSPGEPSNVAAIAAGPAGELYASGAVKMTTFRGVIRKSVDGGATWNTLDAIDPVGMQPIGATGIVVDPAGVVFMIGGALGARVVWRSDDGGETFTRIDEVAIPTETPCNTGAIARAADGTLYTVASCDESGWIVRRGDDGGATWSTVSTFELVAGHRARSGGVVIDAMGRPVVSGQAQDMLDVNHWIVRSAGTDGMWTTLDDYQLVEGTHASAAALGGVTRLYAVGAAATELPDFTGSHWIVRTSDPVTGAWSTADDHSPSDAVTSGARAIHEDRLGALLVVGSIDGAVDAGESGLVARRSDDQGATWQVVDTYSYVAGKPTSPTHMTSDPAGNIYVTARGVDETDNPHWLVRKLACD